MRRRAHAKKGLTKLISLNSVRPFLLVKNNIYLITFSSRKNKCMVASVIILLSNRTLMPLLFMRFLRFFCIFKLGVSFAIINYICLSFIQIHAIFYFNYIIYSDLLIFCYQNAANTLLITLHKSSNHIPSYFFKKFIN